MATKKYQIQQRTGENTYDVLHPETEASIVKLETTNITYGNAQAAIEGLNTRVGQNEANIGTLQNSHVSGVKGNSESTYRTGQVNITKANIGLSNVDNTSDANKPISNAQKEVNTTQAATNTSLGNRITALENQIGGVTGAMHYLGTTSTAVSDGGTQAPTINGTAVPTANLKRGDVVLYGQQEFIWNGTKWELFGDEGSYVLKTTKINGIALSGDITLTAGDINANRSSGDVSVTQALKDLEDRFVNYQVKTDNSLNTTSKTVVGAINEVKTTADAAKSASTTNTTAITNITNGNTTVAKATNATNATNATQFASNKSVELTGDVTGSASSKAGWTVATTLKNSGITAGTYSAVTVNAKGIATSGAQFIKTGSSDTAPADLAIGGLYLKEI